MNQTVLTIGHYIIVKKRRTTNFVLKESRVLLLLCWRRIWNSFCAEGWLAIHFVLKEGWEFTLCWRRIGNSLCAERGLEIHHVLKEDWEFNMCWKRIGTMEARWKQESCRGSKHRLQRSTCAVLYKCSDLLQVETDYKLCRGTRVFARGNINFCICGSPARECCAA